MDQTQFLGPEALLASQGRWFTASPRLVAMPPTGGDSTDSAGRLVSSALAGVLVELTCSASDSRSYGMAERSREALGALKAFSADPSDERLCRFVSDFGPLVLFPDWWTRGVGLLQRMRSLNRLLDSSAFWQMGALLSANYGSMAFLDLLVWCGDHDVAAFQYLDPTLKEPLPGPKGDGVWTLLEPAVMYIWAAQRLADLEYFLPRAGDMRPGGSSEDTRLSRAWGFLQSQLQSVQLTYHGIDAKGNANLSLSPRDLLAQLALTTVLDYLGGQPLVRICRECNRPFTVEHGRQRFCSDQCAWRHRKRRSRHGPATDGMAGEAGKSEF